MNGVEATRLVKQHSPRTLYDALSQREREVLRLKLGRQKNGAGIYPVQSILIRHTVEHANVDISHTPEDHRQGWSFGFKHVHEGNCVPIAGFVLQARKPYGVCFVSDFSPNFGLDKPFRPPTLNMMRQQSLARW
jgi:hypothetical protein